MERIPVTGSAKGEACKSASNVCRQSVRLRYGSNPIAPHDMTERRAPIVLNNLPYFTVLVPWVEGKPTEWHPTEKTGPFSVLTRGAFETKLDAIRWADDHLAGHPYTITRIDPLVWEASDRNYLIQETDTRTIRERRICDCSILDLRILVQWANSNPEGFFLRNEDPHPDPQMILDLYHRSEDIRMSWDEYNRLAPEAASADYDAMIEDLNERAMRS